jgi:ABC-2 type transport system permease protein
MSWGRMMFFGAVMAFMTFTLNGLAVGLGVLFPNFRETNPGRIVSGFGGTLCLVLSFLYILASVLLLALSNAAWPNHIAWVWESAGAFLFLSLLVGWVPFRLGLRQLDRFEF